MSTDLSPTCNPLIFNRYLRVCIWHGPSPLQVAPWEGDILSPDYSFQGIKDIRISPSTHLSFPISFLPIYSYPPEEPARELPCPRLRKYPSRTRRLFSGCSKIHTAPSATAPSILAIHKPGSPRSSILMPSRSSFASARMNSPPSPGSTSGIK